MATESLLTPEAVKIGLTATSREDAISQVGATLLEIGAVEEGYLPAMHEREQSVSTFIGEAVAIPHGTDESRKYVLRTSLAILQFPEGVDWGGQDVRLCVGIAANGSEQVGILSKLAHILMDSTSAAELREAPDAATIIRLLHSMDEEKVQ